LILYGNTVHISLLDIVSVYEHPSLALMNVYTGLLFVAKHENITITEQPIWSLYIIYNIFEIKDYNLI
jgi:hypothetical protein